MMCETSPECLLVYRYDDKNGPSGFISVLFWKYNTSYEFATVVLFGEIVNVQKCFYVLCDGKIEAGFLS